MGRENPLLPTQHHHQPARRVSEPLSAASPERHYPPPANANANKTNANKTNDRDRWSPASNSMDRQQHPTRRAPPSVLSSLALDRELEMDLEASDTTLRRHEEAALRVSEHTNPFSSSRLQPFHALSEQSVARAMQRFRARRLDASNHTMSKASQASNAPGVRPPESAAAAAAAAAAPWKLVKEQADVRVFRSAARRGKTTAMMAHGLVRGSLAEVMDGLYAETTKEARVLYALLSGAFLDVSVLHVDSYRTAQHPFQFAGVTWMALETPRGGCGVCKDRDFVCFKKMGLLQDPDAAPGDDELGFLTLLSVDQPPSDPAAAASFASSFARGASASPLGPAVPFSYMGSGSSEFVRGALSLTAFFKQLPNGLVAMSVQGDFNARGHLAARLADHMFAELVFALGRAAKCGQAKSLAMLLQSMSAGQLPSGGIAASASGSHVAHLLPLLSEKNRDRCGVCAKTLWRVSLLESPEFCRSCWTRTCRHCHVTMPIYCADFHRAHDDDGGRKKFRRLPKPCKETFCLKCVCSVLPNGIKMNAKLLKQTAKKKRHAKKLGGGTSIVTDPSLLRRGIGRTAASARHVPSAAVSSGSRASKSGHNRGPPGAAHSSHSHSGREPGKLYVQIPRPHHHHHLRSRGTGSSSGANPSAGALAAATGGGLHSHARHFDDHSSISMLSSVESEKLQRQRLSLNKPSASKLLAAATASGASSETQASKPQSMLEVLENYQLSQLTTTMSADYSEPLNDDDDDHNRDGVHSELALSYNSHSTEGGASYPADRAPPQTPLTSRKLHVRVNLTPRKRARRSSTASSRNGSVGGSQNSSKRTNYAASPHVSGQPGVFDDAYYNHALQRYLSKRRSSLGLSTSTTMSTDQFESLDKASAEATARAAALAGLRHSAATTAPATTSTSSGSNAGGNGRDAHKLRILRDLEPFPRTPSFLDRPVTPSRLSISSLSSAGSPSSSRASSVAEVELEAAGSHSGLRFDDSPSTKRAKGEWAPPAY